MYMHVSIYLSTYQYQIYVCTEREGERERDTETETETDNKIQILSHIISNQSHTGCIIKYLRVNSSEHQTPVVATAQKSRVQGQGIEPGLVQKAKQVTR